MREPEADCSMASAMIRNGGNFIYPNNKDMNMSDAELLNMCKAELIRVIKGGAVPTRLVPAPRKKVGVKQLIRFFENNTKLLPRPVQPNILYYIINSVMKNLNWPMFVDLLRTPHLTSPHLHLFEKRSRTLNTPRTKIQITLNIDIQSDDIVIQKIFGPFKTSMPRLNNEDMYKFMVYTAMKNNFTLPSAEFISAIGSSIIVYD